jgi:hypothetical protein
MVAFMNSLTRTFLPVVPLAALALLAAGCHGAPAAANSPVTSAASSASAAAAQAASGPAQAVSSAVAAASSAAAGGATIPTAAATPTVYLAEGGTTTGTLLHAPACPAGCELSGDGTVALWNMTWSSWNSAEAVGTGTEKLDDCTPNCAAGTLHAVAVKVVLSHPVLVCAGGKGTWYWTSTSFTWPSGLPAVFSGGDAPSNPFTYSGIASQAAKAC